MRRETITSGDNRAASPFFRVFGGRLKVPEGDAVAMGTFPGSHRLEWLVLGVVVPLVVAAAVFDGLWRLGGGWTAGLGVLPLSFVALHALAFLLGAWSPRGSFLIWMAALAAWALSILLWGAQTPVSWIAWLCLGFALLQVIGSIMMGWHRLMLIQGSPGIRTRMALAVFIHGLIVLIWWQFGGSWGGVAFVGMVLLWALGTFHPTSEIFGPIPIKVQGPEPLLTIDDGPDPDDTPLILDLLDAQGVTAVFFVIGEKVRRFPELSKEIVARGHELANHTMTHPEKSIWSAGPGRIRREIEGCNRAIEEVTGQRPRWFRAPVGHCNFFTHPIAAELGLEVVAWSRRGFDTLDRDVEVIVSDLTKELGSGEILLLHESSKLAPRVVERVLEELAPLKS